MFIANLIKALLIFFLVYFVYNVIKAIVVINKNVKKNVKSTKRDGFVREKGNNSDKVIELRKDQYKVE